MMGRQTHVHTQKSCRVFVCACVRVRVRTHGTTANISYVFTIVIVDKIKFAGMVVNIIFLLFLLHCRQAGNPDFV